MNSSTSVMQLLAVVTFLFASAFANPIKRNDAKGTPLTVPGLGAFYTTIAKADLTTGERVGVVVVVSSQNVYVKQPNYFPATVWGVSGVTPTGVLVSGHLPRHRHRTSTSLNTSHSSHSTHPTATRHTSPFPTYTPASTTTPIAKEHVTVTPESCWSKTCNTNARVTIPVSALTTGQGTAACVTSRHTIGMKEPNHYPNQTWHGISTLKTSASTTRNTTVASHGICTSKASKSQTCNTAVTGVTIPVANLTIGEFVAAHVTCGKTIYIQEPNFYSPKTHYGIPASVTVTSSAAASNTRVAVEPRMLKASAGFNPAMDRSRPTSLHQADEDRFRGVPSAVAGNRAAMAPWKRRSVPHISSV